MSKNDRTLHQLPEIPYGKKPAVLLVGNGINLPFDGAKSTQSIILDEWKSHKGGDAPAALWKLPFPMQVVAATNDSVQGCMKNIAEVFKAQENTDEQNGLLSSVIDVGFDAILSTNYSLEFERLAIADFSPERCTPDTAPPRIRPPGSLSSAFFNAPSCPLQITRCCGTSTAHL